MAAVYYPSARPARYDTSNPLASDLSPQFTDAMNRFSPELNAVASTRVEGALTPVMVPAPSQEGSGSVASAAGGCSYQLTVQFVPPQFPPTLFECATADAGGDFVVGYHDELVDTGDTEAPEAVRDLLAQLVEMRADAAAFPMSFRVPTRTTFVFLDDNTPGGVSGYSPPPLLGAHPKIVIRPGFATNANVVAHEYFHQIVWRYIGWMELGTLDSSWFWSEALATWGSHQLQLGLTSTSRRDSYAGLLPEFLSDPTVMLTEANPLPGRDREYGGYIFIEYLDELAGYPVIRSWLERASEVVGPADLTLELDQELRARGTSFSEFVAEFWQSVYVMSQQGYLGFTDAGAQEPSDYDLFTGLWREELDDAPSLTPGGRVAHTEIHLEDEPFDSGSVTIGAGGAAFVELHKPYYGGDARWHVSTTSPNIRAFILPAMDRGNLGHLGICDAQQPIAIEVTGDHFRSGEGNSTLSAACPVSTLVLVNTEVPDLGVDPSSADWIINLDQSNAVLSTPAIEMGVTEYGNLIDSPLGETPHMGLRLRGQPATEVIGWGCACEGWGVGVAADPNRSGGVSWDNNTRNVSLESFVRIQDGSEVESTVIAGNDFRVAHRFYPSASANLFRVDVSVQYIGQDPAPESGVFYRRAVDWDIPDDVFNEYVTLEAVSGADASFVAHSSDDGFADPDPSTPRTQIERSGFFTDAPPRDQGALVEVSLGSFVDSSLKSFSLYFGAAPSEQQALSALTLVPHQVYSLGQHDPDLGTPVTGIFAVDGASLVSANLADASSRTGQDAGQVLTVDRSNAQSRW